MAISATLIACRYVSPVGIMCLVWVRYQYSRRWQWAVGHEGCTVRSKAFSMKSQTTSTVHPSPAELTGFALGSLDDERAAIVEGHVYRCESSPTWWPTCPATNS